jgi:hypothetical protein
LSDTTHHQQRLKTLWEGLSPAAQQLLVDVMRLEQETLHLADHGGNPDQIVRRAEALIK